MNLEIVGWFSLMGYCFYVMPHQVFFFYVPRIEASSPARGSPTRPLPGVSTYYTNAIEHEYDLTSDPERI
ncbi:hypothetical protein [Sorangium sp. So ce1182]|uniref:hypothetical protein n=1 Tax=Sorangium sp. So ce1182 TaxID=3133334 RepID=UPI003F63351C